LGARSAGVNSPSQFIEEGPGAGPFNFVRYFGEATSAYTQMAALNSQGPCHGCVVNPPASWSFNYAGNTTNRFFFSGGCSSCTDTAAGANLGTAATEVFVLVTVSGGGAAGVPASVNCDTQGVSPVTFNSNSIVMAACDRGNPIYPFFLTGTLTPTVASPTTITLATDQDQTVHTASMGVFAPPFNTTVGSASCSGSAGGALAIAAYH